MAVAENRSVLILDIETSPHLGYVWDIWRGKVGTAKLMEQGQVICFAAKWLGQRTTMFWSDYHNGHEAMVAAAHELIDQADIVVTYNGKKFDLRHLYREFWAAGLDPPSPHKDVDLYQVVRSKFAFPSNSLNLVATTLEIGSKIEHEGFQLWVACLNGDEKAWARMQRYNSGDVRLTERLYRRMLPWIHNHPHVIRANNEELTCNKCGSNDLEAYGTYDASVKAYAKYKCNNCGGFVRAGHEYRIARTFGIQ